MTVKRLIPVLAALAALLIAACGPKPPATPATAPDRTTRVVDSEPTDVTPAPTTTPTEDVEMRELPADIQEANEEAYRRGLLGEVYFAFDSAELESTARDRISRNADFMKEYAEYVITIEGHCDERGTNEYNLALGERRATATRDYLSSLGVAADRVRTISYGEERPQCDQSTESCWAKNRRAYFRITGKR